MKNLFWIAVNGVNPKLSRGTMGYRIFEHGVGHLTDLSGRDGWTNVIAYALEPKEPALALVEVVKLALENRYETNAIARANLLSAIRAVEDSV